MSHVSVIVVNWNRHELLRECLESLNRQTFRDFELIVVDNGSTDGSVEIVQKDFAAVRLISLPENRGFSIGNNIGIQHALGRYIALLNNDAVAKPTWLAALVSAIEQHPEVGFCASKMLCYDRRDLINSAGIIYYTVGRAIDRGWMMPDGPEFNESNYVTGACAGAALYRKAMLDDIGLFDEDFSPAYFEDVDLSLRAQLCGYRCLYVPSAVVYHRVGATLGQRSFATIFLCMRNQWYTLIKNMPSRLLMKYGLEILIYDSFRVLVHAVKGDSWPFLLGHMAVLRKLPVMLSKRRHIQRRLVLSTEEFERLITRGRLAADIRRLLHQWRRWCGRQLHEVSGLTSHRPNDIHVESESD